ncbi:MAG TPA: N-acetylglucosamine-6-phosphate deacetylase [Candidatus Limnocylindria bacterium]|nr:N-acetylglucosamine-6-phosphate deacetylase [Candidatus Limnocylindria bacterium]
MTAGAGRRPSSRTPVILEGRSIHDGRAVRVTMDGGVITSIDRLGDVAAPDWLSAGWLDIQVNGFGGHDPNASGADASNTVEMIRALWRHGVTGVCPTICTESEEHIVGALRAVAAACEADPLIDASVVGIHVEGPHISPEDGPRGAHPLRHVRPPDIAEYRRWQEAAGGRIRIITLSPEYPEAVEYVRAIVADGVVASVGHTSASGDEIRAMVDAGARWSTHLGNGAHAMIRRHPNYIWDQLAEDRLAAGFIFDGHHLPPSVMRSVVRAKGVERTILVSDALYVAAMPPGDYALPDGAGVTLLDSGRLELSGTPYLAGAAAALPVCVANATRHAGLSLGDAVRTVTANPSRLLKLGLLRGHESIRLGARGNVTAFRQDPSTLEISVRATVVGGTLVHADAALA